MRPDIAAVISGSGWNGGQWHGNLVSEDFDVGLEPKVGAIVEFSEHVAYIEELGEKGSFSVSEMDATGQLGSGILHATYYPGSGNTYHRKTDLGTSVQGNWSLQGFIYRRQSGTNIYCDDISSLWGICWTPSSTDVSCQGGENWTLYDFEQGSMIDVSTNEYCLSTGGTGGGGDNDIPTKNSSVKVREIQISDDDDEMISHSLIKEPSQKYHIHSVLENTGDDDAYDIELQYWISENKTFGDDDDEYLASDWIDQIDAGESHEDRKTQDESGNQLRTPNQEGLFYIFAIVIVHEDNSANISDINDDDEYSKLTVKEYIPPPPPMEIKITDPSSGEKWKTDKNHSINWGTTNVPKGSHVKIEYYLYEKNKWYVLDDSTPNDGEKNWDMENKPYRDIIKKDTDAKIRITVVEYPEISIEVKFKIDHKK
jgi:hypothetical protein